MKVEISRDAILNVAQRASVVTVKKHINLNAIRFEVQKSGISAYATDGENEYCGSIGYTAIDGENGNFSVDAEILSKLMLRLQPGMVSFETSDNTVLVRQNKVKAQLALVDNTIAGSEYDKATEKNASIAGDLFKEIARKIIPCISDDLYAISEFACVRIHSLNDDMVEFQAINGHQYASYTLINSDLASILPENGIYIMKKYLLNILKCIDNDTINISLSSKRIFINYNYNQETLSVPMTFTNNEYPDVNVFMDKLKDKPEFIVEKNVIVDCIKKVSVFSTKEENFMFFDFDNSSVKISSSETDRGNITDVIDIEYSGDVSRMGFPIDGMLELLECINAPSVKIQISGACTPCKLSGDTDNSYYAIIMPINIGNSNVYVDEDE